MYRSLKAGFDGLAHGLFWLSMLAMLVMALHVFASAAARAVLGHDLGGTLESTAYYYMPVLAFAALPYLDHFGGHIRADLISGALGPTGQRVLEAVIRLGMAAFFAVLAYYSTQVAIARMNSGEVARSANGFMPVWPGRWALSIAAILASVHYVFAFMDILIGVRDSDWDPAEAARAAGGDDE